MKKVVFSFIVAASVLSFACKSTQSVIEENIKITDEAKSVSEKDISGDNNTADNNIIENSAPEEKIQEKSEAELYTESLEKITLSVISSPGIATKGRSFAKPFVVKVSDSEKNPVADFQLKVRYPSENKNEKISYSEEVLKTGSDGTISFMPSAADFSCNAKAYFFPAPDSEKEELQKIAEAKGVSAEWKVKTNLMKRGGLISLIDYSQKNIPLRETASSSLLLKELINSGFSGVGNYDVPSKDIDDAQAVYSGIPEFVRSSVSYLVFGTIKYAEPITKGDTGFTCSLTATVSCMDLKTGKLLYSTKKQTSCTDIQDWKAINMTREKLAQEIGQSIIFNM